MMINIEEVINVTLEAPSWIKEGLDRGSLERWGGVVRQKDGKIVMLLRESSGLSRELADGNLPSLPSLDSQLSHLQSLSMLSLGTQVLNLGVSAAGFAVVISKLNEIQEQLDQLHVKMDQVILKLGTIEEILLNIKKKIEQILGIQSEIKEGIDWILKKQDLAIVAKMIAAIASIEAVSKDTIRQKMLERALSDLINIEKTLELWMNQLVSTGKCFLAPEYFPFDLYYRTWACCNAAIVQCLLFLKDDEAATKHIQEMYEKNEEIHESYLHILQNVDRYPLINLQITPGNRQILKNTNDLIKITTDRIKGYQLEIEFIQQNDIPYEQWITVGDSEEPRLNFLIPK